MSLSFRAIARLDIKGPNLVKGIQLEGLRVLGKPDKFAKLYYEEGIDELIYQDVAIDLFNQFYICPFTSSFSIDRGQQYFTCTQFNYLSSP